MQLTTNLQRAQVSAIEGGAGESNPCLWTNHSPTNTTHTIALPAQMDSPAYSFDPF